jgi:drug/metabolite transporter, DME family
MQPAHRGALYVAGAAMLWSTGGLFIKIAPGSPLVVAGFRSLFAAPAMLLLLRPGRTRWTAAFWMTAVFYAGTLATFTIATKWTTAANAIFLQYSGAVWVLALSPLVLKEPFRARDAGVIAVCMGGMALFFVGRFSLLGREGDFIAALSGVFYAGTILMLRRTRGPGGETSAIVGNLIVALFALPASRGSWPSSATGWLVYVYLGVVQIGVGYALFLKGIRQVRATEASILGMIEPVFNPIWVFLGFGERPALTSVLGGMIVLSAIGWRTVTLGRVPAEDPLEPVPRE